MDVIRFPAPRPQYPDPRDALAYDRCHLAFVKQAEWLVNSEDYTERRRLVLAVAKALEENYCEGMRAHATATAMDPGLVLKELLRQVRSTQAPL
jgi:hypothetical protein